MSEKLPKSLFKFIIYIVKDYQWWVFILLMFSVMSGSYGTINSYLTKLLIDEVSVQYNGERDLSTMVLFTSIAIVISYEIHALFLRAMNYIRIKVAANMRNKVVSKLFCYVQYHSYNFFQDNFSGTISNNINKMAENIELILFYNMVNIFRGVSQLLFALVAMSFVNPIFSISLLIWVILFFRISIKYAKKMKVLSNSYAKANAGLSGKMVDSISNLNSVRLFANEKYEAKYLWEFLNYAADKFRIKEWFLLKLWWFQGFSITILIAVMMFSLLKLRSQNLITIGDFALILGLVLYVTEGVWFLTDLIDKLYDAVGQCNQSLNMTITPHEIKDVSNCKNLIVSSGEKEFRNVSFYYKESNNIFNNLSITIPGGQKVGLVGFSGSGKTTFVHLITRLFDVSFGEITIDGQNIATISQTSLRKNIGFIPQEPALFHRTIEDNIRYGKMDANDEEIILAAMKAHAHEFIVLTSNGYDSYIGEKGTKLSGGQRQRLSIARAILKNAPILILDEATSALDSVNENYVQDSLSELMQDKTVIVIAHRLSTLLNLDRILVFNEGKIIEDGTHYELLAQNGIYKLLWQSQVDGFLPNEFRNTSTGNTAEYNYQVSSKNEKVYVS